MRGWPCDELLLRGAAVEKSVRGRPTGGVSCSPGNFPRIRPSALIKNVSGTPVAPNRRATAPSGSRTAGNVKRYCVKNVRAGVTRSWVSTPTTMRPCGRNSRHTDSSCGASARHGMHHDAQKLSTTACPRNATSDSGAPENAGIEMAGTAGVSPRARASLTTWA